MDSKTVAMFVVMGILILALVVVIVKHYVLVAQMKKQDKTEDDEYARQLLDLTGGLKDAGVTIESLENLVKAQQEGVLGKIQEINYLKDWIMKVINLSGHPYGDCPDAADPNKECILCELYQVFVLDVAKEIEEDRK
jgi:hypothetical protein